MKLFTAHYKGCKITGIAASNLKSATAQAMRIFGIKSLNQSDFVLVHEA